MWFMSLAWRWRQLATQSHQPHGTLELQMVSAGVMTPVYVGTFQQQLDQQTGLYYTSIIQ